MDLWSWVYNNYISIGEMYVTIYTVIKVIVSLMVLVNTVILESYYRGLRRHDHRILKVIRRMPFQRSQQKYFTTRFNERTTLTNNQLDRRPRPLIFETHNHFFLVRSHVQSILRETRCNCYITIQLTCTSPTKQKKDYKKPGGTYITVRI